MPEEKLLMIPGPSPVLNTVEKRESFLVLSQGFSGERMGQIAQSFDCDIVE